MQFKEESTGIAENTTKLIASPERSGAGGAVLADWLLRVVGKTGHYRIYGDCSMYLFYLYRRWPEIDNAIKRFAEGKAIRIQYAR